MEVRTYPHVSFSFVDEPFHSTWKGKALPGSPKQGGPAHLRINPLYSRKSKILPLDGVVPTEELTVLVAEPVVLRGRLAAAASSGATSPLRAMAMQGSSALCDGRHGGAGSAIADFVVISQGTS